MNIQIEQITYDQLVTKKLDTGTCFIAKDWVRKSFHNNLFLQSRSFFFRITIDGEVIECGYSALGNDGDLSPRNTPYAQLIKTLIPSFVYSKYIENNNL